MTITTVRWVAPLLLLACSDPEPAKTVTQVVGPSGGTIAGPVGASIRIPSGALAQDTTITVKVTPAGSYPALGSFQVAGEVYAFEPHGLAFAAPVTISLPVTGSSAGLVALRSEPGSVWQILPAQIGANAELTTSTFSFYALARAQSQPGPDAGLADAGGGQCSRTAFGPAATVSNMMGTAPGMSSSIPWPELAMATIVDGYAEIGFSGTVVIRLTDYPLACGLNIAGQHEIGGKVFQIFLWAQNVTAGTYTGQHYMATQYSASPGSPEGACMVGFVDGMSPQAASTVIVTAIDTTHVAGSFTTTYLGQPLSGTFDVPICATQAALDPPACCVP